MKKLLLTFLLFGLTFGLFALPGIQSYIPDQPGEFVYYKDNSFARESYIGFLAYDEKNYQLRYYAPATKTNPTEKTVATLVSTDIVNNHFDLTGENIFIADYANEEDVDIINYLHDIIYEFASRRSKLGTLNPTLKDYVNFDSLKNNGLSVNTDYPQFGGDVRIIYDVMVPFFNIKRIEDTKGNVLFECVQLGRISSTEDNLFDKYTPVPESPRVKINSVKPKKAKETVYDYDGRKVVLDSSWEKKLDYLYAQNDDAIISIASYIVPKEVNDITYVLYTLVRNLLESKDNNYIDFNKCDVIFDNNNARIYYDTLSSETKNIFYTAKYLTLTAENTYDYFSFAAKKGIYLQKRSYYDKVIKNNSIK